MKKSVVTTGIVGLLLATTTVSTSASALPSAVTTEVALNSTLAPVNHTLTATAWEHEIGGFNIDGTVSWGVDAGSGPVLDVYEYRIASSDGSIVDRQPTRGEQLSEAQQASYYEEIGFDSGRPYEFNWLVPVCIADGQPVSSTVIPTLESVREWSVTSETTAGYPDFDTNGANSVRASVIFDYSGTMWSNLSSPYQLYFQSQVGALQESYLGNNYDYDAFPTQAVYTDFSCPVGFNLGVRPVTDSSGQELTTRTIDPSNAFIDLGSSDVEKFNLEGFHVLVVGGSRPMNAATWGITKVGPPVEPVPAALATTGAQVGQYVGIAAVVLLLGGAFIVLARRRSKKDD